MERGESFVLRNSLGGNVERKKLTTATKMKRERRGDKLEGIREWRK